MSVTQKLWTGRTHIPYGRSRWERYSSRTYRVRTAITSWPDTTRLGAVCILPDNHLAKRALALGKRVQRMQGRISSASIVS